MYITKLFAPDACLLTSAYFIDRGEVDQESLQNPPVFQNIVIQHMEITEPLTKLRELLEARLSCDLSGHEFYLQDNLKLEPTKNLVEQCVQGEGMVQINVEVKSQPGELVLKTNPFSLHDCPILSGRSHARAW